MMVLPMAELIFLLWAIADVIKRHPIWRHPQCGRNDVVVVHSRTVLPSMLSSALVSAAPNALQDGI
jgi:hypothetical protein